MQRQLTLKMIRIGVLLIIAFMIALPTHQILIVHAGDDPVATINKLAADLHRENVGDGNFTVWSGGSLGKHPDIVPTDLNVSEPMPSFTLKKFGTVQSVTSESLSGAYLLNFWASWCPPCRREFPRLANADQGGELPFPILFVNTGDVQRRANTFLRQQRPKITVLFDAPPEYDLSNRIGMKVFPSSVLVGEDGTVLAIHSGEVTDATLKFFVEIAKSPGKGSYTPKGALEPVTPFATDKALSLPAGIEQYGRLTDQQPYVAYTFEGKKGSMITVSMRLLGGLTEDDAVDPYLVLLNSKGKVIGFDDDSGAFKTDVLDRNGNDLAGSDVDALIQHFKLPANGKYTLIAARAGYEAGMNQGRYQLILISGAAYF